MTQLFLTSCGLVRNNRACKASKYLTRHHHGFVGSTSVKHLDSWFERGKIDLDSQLKHIFSWISLWCILQGSYAVSKVKFKHFSSIFKLFHHLTDLVNYVFIYSTHTLWPINQVWLNLTVQSSTIQYNCSTIAFTFMI